MSNRKQARRLILKTGALGLLSVYSGSPSARLMPPKVIDTTALNQQSGASNLLRQHCLQLLDDVKPKELSTLLCNPSLRSDLLAYYSQAKGSIAFHSDLAASTNSEIPFAVFKKRFQAACLEDYAQHRVQLLQGWLCCYTELHLAAMFHRLLPHRETT